jgi:hypothetical protein
MSLQATRYRLGPNNKWGCPCCGNYTLNERGSYNICPVCFWEDDGHTGNIDEESAPNGLTLREAQDNFKKYEAADERVREHVRPPLPEEVAWI